MYPVIFCSAPALVNLEVPPVKSDPSDRSRFATLLPFELSTVRVFVAFVERSNVVDPPENGIFVSAIVKSLNVLAPVKICVDSKSARVIFPVGRVAFVDDPPVVNVKSEEPAVVKFCPNVNVPVVHVGAPVPPDTNA